MSQVNFLTPNTLLQDRYLVVRPIGKGGMGAVYKAKDTRLRVPVALKQTLLTSAMMRRAFEKEAMLLARLSHPVLPRVTDHFLEGNDQFLVMDYIPGEDLAALLARNGGSFPADDVVTWVLRWAEQLLDALHYLHTQSPPIYHRDIKPQNLKVTARGDVILLDFGLARGGSAQLSTVTAHSDDSIGGFTPNYAPLEQIRGENPEPRSDLYSLAATLYHLLSGQRPPDALSRAAELLNGLADPLRPLIELNPQVPETVSAILHAAMAPNPADRPSSAAMMRRAMRGCRGGSATVASVGRDGLAGSLVASLEADSDVITGDTSAVSDLSVKPVEQLESEQSTPPPAEPGTLLWSTGTGSAVQCLAISRDGKYLAVGGDDQAIGIWDLLERRRLHSMSGRFRSATSLAISPDGRLLVAGSEERRMQIWRMSDGTSIETDDRRSYPADFLAFSPDGKLLASAGWGNAIWLWNVDGERIERRSALMCGFVQSLAFSPDGQMLAAGCYDGSLRIFHATGGYALQTIESHNSFVLSVGFSPDGEKLVTGGGCTSIFVWQTSDGRKLDRLSGHANYVHSLAFAPDGRQMASGSEDKTIRIWQIDAGRQLAELHDHDGGVTALAYTPDGKMLISGCRDWRIRLWQVDF